MPNVTENYGLKKPIPEEFYDVGVQNENMDIIDSELKKRAILGEDGKVPEEQLPDITNIPVTSEVPSDSDIWIDPDDVSAEEAHVVNMNNPHNVTIQQIGAAPAGYGLGENVPVDIAHFDLANRIGWFRSNNGMESLGLTSGWWFGNYIPYGDNEGVWELNHYLDGLKANIRKVNGVLQPAEWVNPPMLVGDEYRTTERYGGKPVYYKLFDFGFMPNATLKQIAHGLNEASYIAVDLSRSVIETENTRGGSLLPINVNIQYLNLSDGCISIKCSVDLSEYHAYIFLKYTKITD